MIPPVALILYEHNGAGIVEIVSRGGKCVVWGVECTYLGPDGFGGTWFARGPGDAAWLSDALLWAAGYVLIDYRNRDTKSQFEAAKERNS